MKTKQIKHLGLLSLVLQLRKLYKGIQTHMFLIHILKIRPPRFVLSVLNTPRTAGRSERDGGGGGGGGHLPPPRVSYPRYATAQHCGISISKLKTLNVIKND